MTDPADAALIPTRPRSLAVGKARSILYGAVILFLVLATCFNAGKSRCFMAIPISVEERIVQHMMMGDNQTSTTIPVTNTLSSFSQASHKAFEHYLNHQPAIITNNSAEANSRPKFDIQSWTKQTTGGLTQRDRIMLGRIYREAESVFEYGLGESTYIAAAVGVPRYAGVDSDVQWVDAARRNSANHFRFHYGDVGDTKAWGFPASDLSKQLYNYQVAPLESEPLPFDVYMVDGRWRIACVLLSFLHASSRGAPLNHTTVLLHDCFRKEYGQLQRLLEKIDGTRMLCVWKRKPNISDSEILAMYLETMSTLW